jgi:hypothetical protein
METGVGLVMMDARRQIGDTVVETSGVDDADPVPSV